MPELKPCPFCGGEAVFVSTCEVPDETPRGYFRCENMCCEQCHVQSKDEAIEAWNRRGAKNPCDLCRFNPPSSLDGKPCTMCVADGRAEYPRQELDFDYGAEG